MIPRPSHKVFRIDFDIELIPYPVILMQSESHWQINVPGDMRCLVISRHRNPSESHHRVQTDSLVVISWDIIH